MTTVKQTSEHQKRPTIEEVNEFLVTSNDFLAKLEMALAYTFGPNWRETSQLPEWRAGGES